MLGLLMAVGMAGDLDLSVRGAEFAPDRERRLDWRTPDVYRLGGVIASTAVLNWAPIGPDEELLRHPNQWAKPDLYAVPSNESDFCVAAILRTRRSAGMYAQVSSSLSEV